VENFQSTLTSGQDRMELHGRGLGVLGQFHSINRKGKTVQQLSATEGSEHPSVANTTSDSSKWLRSFGKRKGWEAFIVLNIRIFVYSFVGIAFISHIIGPVFPDLIAGVLLMCLMVFVTSSFVFFRPRPALAISALPILLIATWVGLAFSCQCFMDWLLGW
jgi:hypothetical protein